MAKTESSGSNHCPTCGNALDPALSDLGCTVCLLQAGLENHSARGRVAVDDQYGTYVIVRRPDGTREELGRGAMGITYRATDTTLNRPVALKIIHPQQRRSDHTRARFMREARAAAGLHHQNIAAVHHFGAHEGSGQYFYAMELVEGETLEEHVRRRGPLPASEVIAIAQQVVAALAAAEKRGLIHRDLKPANIMLVNKGEDDRAPALKIIDFGLAKAVADESNPMAITNDGFVGSPLFASPEQFAGAALDVRSDIFSLGVTLWFALTGKTPFPGCALGEIQIAQKASPLPIQQLKRARVPTRLIGLLKSMLALEPAARPGAAELGARLQNCAASGKRSWPLRAAAAALLAGALIFLVARLNHQSKPAPNEAARAAFLKGRYFWNKRNETDFHMAKNYFERAIALDPSYAQAYAGLADTYQFIANSNRQVRDEYYAAAKRTATRASQLDPALAEPHASLGLIAMNYGWDWAQAEREFKRAIALNPRYATAHQWYAAYLNAQGRFDEAIARIECASQLDPLSSIINADTGMILLFAGRRAAAEEKLKETLKLNPTFAQAHFWLSGVYLREKRYDDALAELKFLEKENVGESPNGTAWSGQIGYIYAVIGDRAKAEQLLLVTEKNYADDPRLDHVSSMIIYLGLGRSEEVFACLEDEYRAHSTSMTSLKTHPIYDDLRRDPRFDDLLRRVRLAP